jgi:hypothetical protein
VTFAQAQQAQTQQPQAQQDQKPPPPDPAKPVPQKPDPKKPAPKPGQPQQPVPQTPDKPQQQPPQRGTPPSQHPTQPPQPQHPTQPAGPQKPTPQHPTAPVQPQHPTQPPQQQPQRGTPPQRPTQPAQPQRPTQPVRPQQSEPQRPAAPQRPLPAPPVQPQRQTQSAQPAPQRGLQQGQPQGVPPARGRTDRLPQPQQQALVTTQQQRLVTYDTHLVAEQRIGSQYAVQLQTQNRPSQYAFQLQYISGLTALQVGIRSAGNYNYGGDPYFYTPSSYRYYRGTQYYETNEYGADMLRSAVNHGYEEGFETGRADLADHWRFSYQESYGYRDANYGYSGFYVDRDNYNYYFREGFRRGYDDAYYGRHQYGEHMGDHYVVQPPVLSVILHFDAIR